jgi:hypothetical protein
MGSERSSRPASKSRSGIFASHCGKTKRLSLASVMGRYNSGRYKRGSRLRATALREESVILDAREMVVSGLIRGDKSRSSSLQAAASDPFCGYVKGTILVSCGDTLPLWQQSPPRHRMELGSALLEYTPRHKEPVRLEITLIAGLTRLDVIFWGFKCPRCHRYCRKLFLPVYRSLFLCRTCHRLRYISQDKLDKMSREVDDWETHSRLMGVPSPKFWRKMQRAGQAIWAARLPYRE